MSAPTEQSWEILMKTGDVTTVHGVTDVRRNDFGDTIEMSGADGLAFIAPVVAVAYAQRIDRRGAVA